MDLKLQVKHIFSILMEKNEDFFNNQLNFDVHFIKT